MSSREPIWALPEPSSGRAAYTRADIAQAAIRVADAEGIEAVSMRRIAKELGAGTMSLYHYVRDKDDLVDLMSDLVIKEYLVDDSALAHDWRTSFSAIARATRAALRNHPWLLEAGAVPALGPHTMAHVEQTAHAAQQLGIEPMAAMEIAGMLDEYILGCLTRETSMLRPNRQVDPHYWQWLMDSGDYPNIAGVVDAHIAAGGDPDDLSPGGDADGRFERGLERVLDGIAVQIDERP